VGLRTPNPELEAAAERVLLRLGALVAGLSLLLATILVSHQSSTFQTEVRLLAAARRCGVDPKQGVAGIVPALAWTRAARTWRLHPGAWRSPLVEQRILLAWPCAEIEAAWLEEVATPLAKHLYGRSVDALSDREVAGLLIGLQSPGGIRWALCSDDPRAESIRNVLRTGTVDRPDSWALWCSERPP
jgi:hypothetical protein